MRLKATMAFCARVPSLVLNTVSRFEYWMFMYLIVFSWGWVFVGFWLVGVGVGGWGAFFGGGGLVWWWGGGVGGARCWPFFGGVGLCARGCGGVWGGGGVVRAPQAPVSPRGFSPQTTTPHPP